MKQQFAKLRHAPAYRALAEAIMREILERRIPAGAQLPTEAELCQQFGVNRSTVREGIRLMEETGMVRREGGKRLVVSKPTHAEVGSRVERALIMHQVTFRELWGAAMVLEPALAELSAKTIDAEDIDLLADNLKRTKTALAAKEPLAELDAEFHSLISRAAHNRALLLSREPLGRLFYPSFQAVLTRVPKAGKRLLVAHQAIFDALSTGNAEGGREWMRKHIIDFRRGYELAGLDLELPVEAQALALGEKLDSIENEA